MNKFVLCSLAASLSLATAVSALAQSEGASGRVATQSSTQAEAKAGKASATAGAQTQSNLGADATKASAAADAQMQANAETDAAKAAADAQAQANAEATLAAREKLQGIRDKGAKVSAEARAKAEKRLDAAAQKVNDEASAKGDAKVAARLAAEFGMTSDQLIAEKQELDASWGNLMIAHSLDANSKTDVTAAQLMELRAEGIGWGQIAAGLGLKLGDAVSAVQAESRVAAGLSKPDGKVATIHGEGARAGLGVDAGTNVGVHAGGADATAHTGIGVGLKIKP